MFQFFKVSELFASCDDKEVLECVNLHYIDCLLVLLQFLDGLRSFAGYPIKITSSYRDALHNVRVGGVPTSQHLVGAAIDFYFVRVPFETQKALFKEFAKNSALSRFLGQVIFYNKRNFIHIGLRTAEHKELTYYEQEVSKANS